MISVMGMTIKLPNVLLRLTDHFSEKALYAAAMGFYWDHLEPWIQDWDLKPIFRQLFKSDGLLITMLVILWMLETLSLMMKKGWDTRRLKQHINDAAGMAIMLIVATLLSNSFELLSWLQTWTFMVFALLIGKAISDNLGQLDFWNSVMDEIRRRTGQGPGQGNGSGPTSSGRSSDQ